MTIQNIGAFSEVSSPLSESKSLNQFPLEVFPFRIQEALHQVSNTLGFDMNYLASGVLTTTSVMVGARAHVRVKKGWSTPCNLWSVIIGNASNKKSPTQKFSIDPLNQLNLEAIKTYEENLKTWEIDYAQIENKQERELYLANNPAPEIVKFIVKDINQEALVKRFKANPHGLLLLYDEIMGWVKSMDRYNRAGDVQYFLSLYDGDTISVDRASYQATVTNPFLSISGGIQPSKLFDLFSDGRKDDGFVYRFLFTFPEKDTFTELTTNSCDDAFERYQLYMQEVHRLACSFELKSPFQLSNDALEIFLNYYNHLLREAQGNDHQCSLRGKILGYIPKFAVLWEFIHLNDTRLKRGVVSAEAIEASIKIAEFYRHQIDRAFFIVNSAINLKGIELEIYNHLPLKFTKKELQKLVEEANQALRSYERSIEPKGKWIKEGLVEKITQGKYRKLK